MRRGGGGRRGYGNYTNPCLTMHQPWASLLVYGIKRIEGRSWTAPIRGNKKNKNISPIEFIFGANYENPFGIFIGSVVIDRKVMSFRSVNIS